MDNNRTRNNRNGNDNGSNAGLWTAVAIGAGALVAGGVALASLLSQNKKKEEEQRQRNDNRQQQFSTPRREEPDQGLSSYFSSILRTMDTPGTVTPQGRYGVEVPETPNITNLSSLLHDIYVRHVAIRDDDFQMYYGTFTKIFQTLHKNMKSVDKYYNKYSSTVQIAGSHYDRLRIDKPNEFDVDILIDLPINIREDRLNPAQSDVVLEPKSPGYIQLKMGTQFQRLPHRDGEEWFTNKIAHEWMDPSNYLLRSKFAYWFRSVVDRALNNFGLDATSGRRFIFIDGIKYTIRLSESGPATTLIIENLARGLKLDVDLVPALKFFEERWPICKGYRQIPPNCSRQYWSVVPKPNKAGLNRFDTERSWRLALHLQERDLMHDTNHLRQAIRLIKKLRDSQGMHKIASYYIKTLFYLEVLERNDPAFWNQTNPAKLFTIMVKKFYDALWEGKIPYLWHKDNNLIGHINRTVHLQYASKLKKLIDILDDPSPQRYKLVAKYLLNDREYDEYKRKYLDV